MKESHRTVKIYAIQMINQNGSSSHFGHIAMEIIFMEEMKMKKLTVLLLVLAVAFSAFAQGGSEATKQTTTQTPAKTEKTAPAAPATYTLNQALSVFPTNWNTHTYETNTETEIGDYIQDGFYTFDYNEDETGYKVVPAIAVGEPKDVTAEYVGKYGITEDSVNQAYVITIRQDLKWDDGTPINAYDFVESQKRLLNPVAQNYRADNLYSGNMVVYNAKEYLYQGKTVELDNGANAGYTMADLHKGADGQYYSANEEPVYIGLDFALAWTNNNTLNDYVGAYGDSYFDTTNWEVLMAEADGKGLIPLTDENYALFVPVTTNNPNWGETEDDVPNYFVYATTYAPLDWSEVGYQALSDYEILICLTKPLKGFYLLYSLTGTNLVKIDLYDACESIVDGVYTNTYCTSAETTPSYGPYKLTSFQADKQFVLERNDNYYLFNDRPDLYQTTSIVTDYVPEASTRLELFLQGKLDGYGLTIDDMKTYSLSDYCYYTPGDSVFFMAFNPDPEKLATMQAAAGAGINKTILTLLEFRQAMSFALNRADFCLATSPTNEPGFGLYSDLIICDPENGTPYRSTDQAKNVLVNFWGLKDDIGEGKLYEDVDEAIESITGYNLTKAKQLYNQAYDMAIAQGIMSETDVVEIKIGTPNGTSKFYNNGYEYLVNCYTEAVKGTKFEGKLRFTRDDTLGNGFADALKNCQVDMLFGVGWTGSTLDPYNLMEAYTSSSYQYNPCWDTTKENLTINIHGVDYTASVKDWNDIMMGEARTISPAKGEKIEYSCGDADNDPETRLDILAALEMAVLMTYEEIPIMGDASASLKGMQIKYYTENYIFGMGRGGIKYYTYNYTDAEWDAYCASQNYVLKYN